MSIEKIIYFVFPIFHSFLNKSYRKFLKSKKYLRISDKILHTKTKCKFVENISN